MFRSVIWLTAMVAISALPGEAQFKSILKSAGKKLEDTARGKATGTPEPPAQPAATPAPQAPSKPAGNTAAAAPKPKEIRPGLAVDEAIVAAQAAKFLQKCQEQPTMASNGIDCNCGAAQFPQIRLEELSALIADHERFKEMRCADPIGCKRWTDTYNRMISQEFQKSFEPRWDLTVLNLSQRPACRDYTALAAQKEQECLANPRQYHLQPGQSTKAFCACLKDEFPRTMQEYGSDGSKKLVHSDTSVVLACQEKTRPAK